MIIKQLAHFLADEADHDPRGTFWVRGGGITDINAEAWPARAKVTLITRLELDIEAAADLHHMQGRVWHEQEGELTTWRQPLAVKMRDIKDVTRPVYFNMIGNIEFLIPAPGMIGIDCQLDEMQLPTLRMMAITTPPGTVIKTTPAPSRGPRPPGANRGGTKRRRRR